MKIQIIFKEKKNKLMNKNKELEWGHNQKQQNYSVIRHLTKT